MIGIVLWSEARSERAIVWCDDQGHLAFLRGRADYAAPGPWPDVGAVLCLRTETVGAMRYARAARPAGVPGADALPVLLMQAAHTGATPPVAANCPGPIRDAGG